MKKILLKSTAFALLLTACDSGTSNQQVVSNSSEDETMQHDINAILPPENTLKAQLDEKRAAFEVKASEEKKRVYAEGIDSVAHSGVLENAMNVGDTAPDFTLTNATRQPISLKAYLAKGPVVLTWYRGGWCPYCNITLRYLQEKLPEFRSAGAQLLALTPELPDKSMTTKEKNEIDFEVLSDINNEIARKYGVVYRLTDQVAGMYEKGFGLSDYNGNQSAELPLAATYVIDQNGVIRYAFLDAEYRNRAEPNDILAVLKSIN